MADRVDAATRSRIMRAIKSQGTKPEVALAAALAAVGVVFEQHAKLPGSPDFVVASAMLAVFSHGCFWHACPRHHKPPKSRVEAWRQHFAKNRRRDERVRRQLRALGWRTMVVWEHEDPSRAAERVRRRCQPNASDAQLPPTGSGTGGKGTASTAGGSAKTSGGLAAGDVGTGTPGAKRAGDKDWSVSDG